MKQIKKFLALTLVLCTAALNAVGCLDSCDCSATSRSHLAIRPHFQSASPEMISGFRNDRLHAREDGNNGAIEFVIFGSKTNNCDELARYFLPFCKNQIRVASETSIQNGNVQADVLAEHFNIFTTNDQFESVISLAPEQSVFGFGIYARKSFWRNEERNRGFFASISIPIERVKNNMNLTENVINDGGGAGETLDTNVVANMKEAFNQKEWNHCKISCGDLTESGVADIEIKIGYEWLSHEPCHLESYIGLLAPAGKKGCDQFMWAPQVGHGDHFGIMFGGAFGAQIWADESKDSSLRFEMANHTQYLFEKTHCRCFDLKCKPWSKFIEVYRSREEATEAAALGDPLETNFATPGVNVFNLAAKVTPGFSHNMTSAFVYSYGKFQGEIGYNFYCRQAECVKLAGAFPTGIAIKSINGDGQTNPERDITGNLRLNILALDVALAQYDNSVLNEDDVDLVSASAPCGLSHTFYGAIGGRWDDRKYPIIANIGASYEKGKGNNGLADRWTVWSKLGFSF